MTKEHKRTETLFEALRIRSAAAEVKGRCRVGGRSMLESVLGPVLACLVACAPGGCRPNTLMKTPTVIATGATDPFEAVPPERQSLQATILIASARSPSGEEDPARFYTDDRSRVVRLGMATLSIGEGRSWDQIVAESRSVHRSAAIPVRVEAIEEFGPLWTSDWPPDIGFAREVESSALAREPADRFVATIESLLGEQRSRVITIFVHGFNTTFQGNLVIAAEFWHYLARDGVMISFDWPSRGNLFSYQVDKANAEFAVRQFRRLIEFLAERTSATRINIVAHSAGCPIVAEALRHVSLIGYDLGDNDVRARSRIGRVVLAAPDMDLDAAYSASVDGSNRVADAVAVYASRKDNALGFSSGIFGDIRLGRSIGRLDDDERSALIAHEADWVDVTRAQSRSPSLLGHSYFHQSPWVSSDVLLFLLTGASAEERGLVRDPRTGFMVFPEDYETRLPETVAALRARYDNEMPQARQSAAPAE